jgi:hypothetical protein
MKTIRCFNAPRIWIVIGSLVLGACSTGAAIASGSPPSSPPGPTTTTLDAAGCSPWDASANLTPESGVADIGTVRQDSAGIIYNEWYRICRGRMETKWVPVTIHVSSTTSTTSTTDGV